MKKEMEKMVKKSEKMVKKGEEMVKDVYPKVMDATQDFRDSVAGIVEKGTQSAQNLFEKRDATKKEVVELVSSKGGKLKEEIGNAFESKSKKKNTGKVVAGVALASLAASAYAIYKMKKIKNDNLKVEYSEKLQKWAELDISQFDTETGDFNEPLMVMPKRVYKVGSNAKVGDGIIINISKPSEDFFFNPEDEGKPVADLDIKKKIMDKTTEVKDKIKSKIEETKLQSKLGTMEAKDKYVEIKDFAEDKLEDVKSKFDEEITPNIKETKEKAEDLKDEVEDKIDDIKSNNMDFDDKDKLEGKEPEEPFGADEVIEDAEDIKKGIKEKAKELADTAKAKLTPDEDVKEEKNLVEYDVSIHNGSEKDYAFSPMQIQLYNLLKRSVRIRAKHEQGTTLGPVTIKAGETYTGKIFIQKTTGKPEGLVVFKDLGLNESILYLLNDGEPVEEPEMILDEDYLYSDEMILKDEEYKRQ